MTSFETSVQKAVDQSIKKTVKGYVEEFSTKLADALNSGKKRDWDKDSFISLWNKIATNVVINPKKKEKEADPSVPQCEHVYGKGDKKDKRCTDKVSEKSETKSFCSRHYKQKESVKDEKKPKDKNDKFCCYILTKGKNKDDECGAKVSDKCDKGKYCNKHRNTDDKKEKPKKKTSGKEPIRAYRIKDGKLKGFHVFEKGGKKYVIESETRTIKGREEDGKLVDLDDDDIKMVRDTHPFKLDKKYESLSKNLQEENEEENEEDDEENEEEDEENEEEEEEENSSSESDD